MPRFALLASLFMTALACRSVDQRTFAGVDAAARALQTAMDGTRRLSVYQGLLSTYAKELSAARQSVTTSDERRVLAEYDAALTRLTDLRLVWEEREARRSDMLPISEELGGRIAREYQLGVNTNEPPSIYASEALQLIWEQARSHLEQAQRLLAG